MNRALDWVHAGLSRDQYWAPLFFEIMVHGRPLNTVFPRVFSNVELARIQVPVQLLFGDHERIYGGLDAALAAAAVAMPNAEVHIVPDAHHIAGVANPEAVTNHILAFTNAAEHPGIARMSQP